MLPPRRPEWAGQPVVPAGSAPAGRVAENSGDSSDREILRLLDQHSPLAIELLYDQYGARVYSVAVALIRDEAAAEALTLNAFLAVWRGARPCDGCGGLAQWMVATVIGDARRMSA